MAASGATSPTRRRGGGERPPARDRARRVPGRGAWLMSVSGSGPRYGPADASAAPRYTGVRTFARCPHVTDPAGVDVAVVGVPFDTATSMRPGARFGPAGIRDPSLLLR